MRLPFRTVIFCHQPPKLRGILWRLWDRTAELNPSQADSNSLKEAFKPLSLTISSPNDFRSVALKFQVSLDPERVLRFFDRVCLSHSGVPIAQILGS